MQPGKRSMIRDMTEALIVLILIACMVKVMVNVTALQGTARVVNYTGIVRGATQRLIKLELMHMPNRDLEMRLDGILSDLISEQPGANNLILLPDDEYKACLNDLGVAWLKLKRAIADLRSGEEESELDTLRQSEDYFRLADDTVSAAEVYSQSLATDIQTYENIAIVMMVLAVLVIVYTAFTNVQLLRHNKELDRMAYIDAHTGLPNKGRCEQMLANSAIVEPGTAVIVFDLNFLKKVNDELGHDAGDSLIRNFALLLRNNVPSHHFVGRFGGDEFIVVAHGVDHPYLRAICDKLDEASASFNSTDHGYTLSFARGYALSDDFADETALTYKVLFDKADFNMYEHKKEMKAKLQAERGSTDRI